MSSQELDFSEIPKEENKLTKGREMLYRYEYEGVLVYDVYSRLSSSSTPLESVSVQEPKQLQKSYTRGSLEYGISYSDRLQYENMKAYPPFRQFVPQYTLVAPQEQTLVFDSRFESGNLHKAIKINENEYNLLIDFDTETLGHTQWYYFSVRPFKSFHSVRFNIINLLKFESLYNEGMKPLVYSEKTLENQGIDWHRDGFNLGYYQNSYHRQFVLPDSSSQSRYYYTFTFTYTFKYADDQVFFAYSYPYTYSDLKNYISSIYPKHSQILRVNDFCKTLAGNPCYVFTITHNIETYKSCSSEKEKLQKTSAGRRYMKLKELKAEARLKNVADEGKK